MQRAGGEGFVHNEVNLDPGENRMIQIGALPEEAGQPAGYRVYRPVSGGVTRISGGPAGQQETFPARIGIDIALLDAGGTIGSDSPFVGYLTGGAGIANGGQVAAGDLFRGERLTFEAGERVQLILVRERP